MKRSYAVSLRTRIVLPDAPADLFDYAGIVCPYRGLGSEPRCLGPVTDQRPLLAGIESSSERVRLTTLDATRLMVRDAAEFLREALAQMTSVEAPIVNENPKGSRDCILLTTISATPKYRDWPVVWAALRPDLFERLNDPSYNEAYAVFIESLGAKPEDVRVVVLGNTVSGLLAGVVALVDSAGYEVLGFGPDWVHAPRYKPPDGPGLGRSDESGLVFRIDLLSGRPGYLLRRFGVSDRMNDVGVLRYRTIADFAGDPAYARLAGIAADRRFEYFEHSERRWRVGRRIAGSSIPAAARFHGIGAFTGAALEIGAEAVFTRSDDRGAPPTSHVNFAHSQVRQLILDRMWLEAGAFFDAPNHERMPWFLFDRIGLPDGWYHVEGDGRNLFGPRADWYPRYRAAAGRPLGEPYRLHGLSGIDQPVERFDVDAVADQLGGLANWLLDQFDLRVDATFENDAAKRARWKANTRVAGYCYGRQSVPPGFNLDSRVAVMFGGGASSLGRGRWCAYVDKRRQMPAVFRTMGLRDPGPFLVYESFVRSGLNDVFPIFLDEGSHDWVPDEIRERIRDYFDAGVPGYALEHFPTFGRDGLRFYLLSELLWNPTADDAAFEGLVGRWFRRAFGSGAAPMRQAFEWMLRENLPYNDAKAWGEAIDLIDRADRLVDPRTEAAAKRRIDDVKLHWYYYFILRRHFQPRIDAASGEWDERHRAELASLPELREYVFKSQLAYMAPIGHVCERIYREETPFVWLRRLIDNYPPTATDPSFAGHARDGRPYFESAELDAIWARITAEWSATRIRRRFAVRPGPYLERMIFVAPDRGARHGRDIFHVGSLGEPVETFPGEIGRVPEFRVLPELDALDENDLVQVAELQAVDAIEGLPALVPAQIALPLNGVIYFHVVANRGQAMGCHLVWPGVEPVGIENSADYWDAAARRWRLRTAAGEIVCSRPIAANQIATVRLIAPLAGTYRVRVRGVVASPKVRILLLHADPESGVDTSRAHGGMVFGRLPGGAETAPVASHLYFYVPRGCDRLESHSTAAIRGALRRLLLFDGPVPAVSYNETDRIQGLRYDDTPAGGHTIEPIESSAPIDIRSPGYYTLEPLSAQYRGSLVSIKAGPTLATGRGDRFARAPYFYTLPNWLATSPAALLVPRRVAEIDGLTIVCPRP